MLPDYDARAIAEVMGLAFVQGMAEAPMSAAASTSSTRRPSAATRQSGGYVISVRETHVLMVEIKADNHLVPFARSKSLSGDRSSIEKRRISSPSFAFIERAVEQGLPRSVLRHVAQSLAGDDETKLSAVERSVVPKTTLERREHHLSPQESERTERLARLFVHARRALGTAAEAREFVTTPHPELDGRSPLEAAKTDLGTRRAEQILNALEYGLAL